MIKTIVTCTSTDGLWQNHHCLKASSPVVLTEMLTKVHGNKQLVKYLNLD